LCLTTRTQNMGPLIAEFHDRRIHFQRHETRLSMTENWNSCLDAARGGYFLLLSDDDALAPEGLTSLVLDCGAQMGFDDSSAGLCYGRAVIVDSTERPLWTSFRGVPQESALEFYRGIVRHRRASYPCGTLFRTEALREVGGYDGNRFGAAADIGAAISVALRLGTVRHVGKPVCTYTEHTTNMTGQVEFREWARTFREIESLVEASVGIPDDQLSILRADMNDFVAYFVMDVTGKRALDSGRGLFRSWRDADRARRLVVRSAIPEPV